MRSTKSVQRLAVGLGGLVMVAGVVAGVGAAQGSDQPSPPTARQAPNVNADIASGKAHRLPEGPGNWHYTSVWRNCGFVHIKTHDTRYMDDGGEVVVDDSTPAEVAAQMPPVDPACVGAKPTPAQIATDSAEIQALSNAARPNLGPGAPAPLPPVPPPAG